MPGNGATISEMLKLYPKEVIDVAINESQYWFHHSKIYESMTRSLW